MPDFLQALIKSRRFWVAVAGLLIVFVRDKFEFLNQFTDEQITQAVLLVAGWIVGESLRSSSPAKVEEKPVG